MFAEDIIESNKAIRAKLEECKKILLQEPQTELVKKLFEVVEMIAYSHINELNARLGIYCEDY